MTLHTLKLNDDFFDAVKNGTKPFEVRKNDRDFKVGDTLKLIRVDKKGEYLFRDDADTTHRSLYDTIEVKVTYILTHEQFPIAIKEGFIVMGIERIEV